MTVLSVIQEAAALVGFDEPSTVVGNTDLTVTQLVRHLMMEGRSLAKATAWRDMKRAHSLTGDGATTLFDLPADYDRATPGRVLWESDGIRLNFTLCSDEEFISARTSQVFLNRKIWRLYGDQIEFYPAPDNGQVIEFEYRTTYWITSDTGDEQSAIEADTDLFLVPETVLVLGCVWRFKSAKGFTFDQDFANYDREKSQHIFADQPPRDIRIARRIVHPGMLTGTIGDVPNIVP